MQQASDSRRNIAPGLEGVSLRLASASARRLALLRQVGIEPRVRPAAVDETPRPGEDPESYVLRMACDKRDAVREPGPWIHLGADTAVVLGEEILGKPEDGRDAARMLSRLSGGTHQVITAVAAAWGDGRAARCRAVATLVRFKPLSPEEIAAYVATGEPLDKAGAYAIQGIGAFMVERIQGSYSGVVGLPLFETLEMLRAVLAAGEAGG